MIIWKRRETDLGFGGLDDAAAEGFVDPAGDDAVEALHPAVGAGAFLAGERICNIGFAMGVQPGP